MARNDGKDYSVARNGTYTRSQIGNIERHNERKNEIYQNTDVQLECSHRNIYFKKPTDSYLGMFDSLCADGTISTKGLKATAVIIDEMLLDVNTAYFEKSGGISRLSPGASQRLYKNGCKDNAGGRFLPLTFRRSDDTLYKDIE